jgi:hypothetical protein
MTSTVSSWAGMNILAGATLGGGTRVNWQASFRTPEHVRREWAQQHGLPAFMSEQFDEALDAVCARVGVTTGEECSAPKAGSPHVWHDIWCCDPCQTSMRLTISQ